MGANDRRSSLAIAIGLGSARAGSAHWWAERVSAVALIPLTFWFIASIIAHSGDDHAAFTAWLGTPLVSAAMILLLIALFHHTALGLQVVLEDYVNKGSNVAAILCVRLGCFGLTVVGVLAILRVAFGR